MSRSIPIRLCGAVLHGQAALLQAIEIIEGEEHQFFNLDITPDPDNGPEPRRSYTFKGSAVRMNSDNSRIEFTAKLHLIRDTEGWRISDDYVIVEIEEELRKRNPPKERHLVWWEYHFRGNPVIAMKVTAPTVNTVRASAVAELGVSTLGHTGISRHDRRENSFQLEVDHSFFPEL